MNYSTSTAQRPGGSTHARGDLTGARVQSANRQREAAADGLLRSRNALAGAEACVTIVVDEDSPRPRAYQVPKSVVDFLRGSEK